MRHSDELCVICVALALLALVLTISLCGCGGEYEGQDTWDAPVAEDVNRRPVHAYIIVQPAGEQIGKTYKLYGPELTLRRLECLELCTCRDPDLELHCMCPCEEGRND